MFLNRFFEAGIGRFKQQHDGSLAVAERLRHA